jgi:uncharacterized protein YjiK
MKNLLFLVLAAMLCQGAAIGQKKCLPKAQKIKPVSRNQVKVHEPSDAALSAGGNSLYVVSDNGYVAEVGLDGSLIRQSEVIGTDFEGVCVENLRLLVMDETPRSVREVSLENLTVVKNHQIAYAGGRNKGFESLSWNEKKQVYVAFTEKDPVWLFELNADFQVVNQLEFCPEVRDISSAGFYNGYLWLLSDEDRTLLKVDTTAYTVLATWKLPLINPEGFVFTSDGKLIVLSDDMEMMYTFDNPEVAK